MGPTPKQRQPYPCADLINPVALALADPVILANVQREFLAVTGANLTDPATQLFVSPVVFRADSMPTRDLGPAANCGAKRCAELLMATNAGIVINVLPIVNLSTRTVLDTQRFLGGN